MKGRLLEATDSRAWRAALEAFGRVDVCQMPEYHLAYSTRTPHSKPVMWCYEEGGAGFCYPLLLAPVTIGSEETGYSDISSVYGYSGPLASTSDKDFLAAAWKSFDAWARERKVIAEFTRFSLYADNRAFAHPATKIELNRISTFSRLAGTDEDLLAVLGKKTRNMIRKAEKSGLAARELEPREWMQAFRALYERTMDRNEAIEFHLFDDRYFELLLGMPPGELRLFGVFHGDRLVAAAIALIHKKGALYHLGASLREYNHLGAGNLYMFEMSRALLKDGVEFLTVGGGRTTAEDDPLFRFKKSNATSLGSYYIGTRIADPAGYQEVVKSWQALYKTEVSSQRLQFYR